ncbi:hypothetical protein [Caldicellulosiruptor morganii]|uniref:SLH domain-containing protein n=1 Tax=Caldicellulosiruptor morganii TaxID=1387555 RepID=A0ABY7BQK8_9FIRM|nr:hypothetical protein [Caldicellulosiruptor morganii]WAM33316.1 hypothetical protein OTK00_001811 [Caldicellulosiruptor morganii]
MRKLLSFLAIISLLLSFAFPVAHAGTISKTVQTVSNKVQYITANEFVTSLLMAAKVKPNGIADYWTKAVQMGLIPAEVKKDRGLTRAQASYIVWKLINAVPELRDKNIPVKTVVLSPVDYTFWSGGDPTHNFRGAYVAWGPGDPGYGMDYTRFNSRYAVITYDLVVIDKYYKDGTVKTVHVWNRLKDYFLPLDWWKVLQRFMKENPDKVKFDLPSERLKAQVWVLGHKNYLARENITNNVFAVPGNVNRKLYSLFYIPKDFPRSFGEGYSFFTLKFHMSPQIDKMNYPDGKPLYWQIFLLHFKFGLYKSENIYDWQWTVELNPVTNEALNRWLMKLPRKFPLDYTRFKYICIDFDKIPKLYQEPLLRLADLGIIQPEANVSPSIFKDRKKFITIYNTITWQMNRPILKDVPDIKFNAGKLLTRAEAVDIITKVFDESKRVVFDEMTFKTDTIDDYGYNYGFQKRTGDIPDWACDVLYYHTGKTITYRIDEIWQLLYCKHKIKTEGVLMPSIGTQPIGIVFDGGYGGLGTTAGSVSLYDGTLW